MCEFSICFSRKVISFARQSRQWQKQDSAISLSHGPRLALRHEKKAASRTISRCSLLIPYSKGGCDPAGIQTQDLQNRNLTLYSAKLPGQCGCKVTQKTHNPKENAEKHTAFALFFCCGETIKTGIARFNSNIYYHHRGIQLFKKCLLLKHFQL